MTVFSVFAPLFRALTGGSFTSRNPIRAAQGFARNGEWWDLLFELELPETTFADVIAAASLELHFHYRHFTKPKKDGGRREIVEPDVKLKRIQHAIIDRYFASEKQHPAAIAYCKDKSIANHVWPHAGAEWLITADVADYFTATREGRIEDWWRDRVDANLARLLTLLTTYRGALPQGAPTSPSLSNFVNRELDERLAGRARAAEARYTRYCDDMVFSWQRERVPPADFENGVRATLHEFGYILHPKKGWQVYRRRDEPEITGVILTRHGRVRMPDRLRQIMHRLARSKDAHDAWRLAGYLGYEAMIHKRPRC